MPGYNEDQSSLNHQGSSVANLTCEPPAKSILIDPVVKITIYDVNHIQNHYREMSKICRKYRTVSRTISITSFAPSLQCWSASKMNWVRYSKGKGAKAKDRIVQEKLDKIIQEQSVQSISKFQNERKTRFSPSKSATLKRWIHVDKSTGGDCWMNFVNPNSLRTPTSTRPQPELFSISQDFTSVSLHE